MRESLRARLLFGHTITVAAVIAVFAASLAGLTWRSRMADIDATLAARAALLARAIEPTTEGRIDLTLGPSLRDDDPAVLYHVIWTRDGTPLDSSNPAVSVPKPSGPGIRTHENRREFSLAAPSGVLVLVGRDLTDAKREVWSLAVRLVGLGGGILLLSAGVGWWLVGRALEPLDRINRTALRMTSGDLAARIQVDSVDSEVSQVARALNSAFDRLQSAVDRQRRFTADASHELRTPLTTLSTEVQWALKQPRSAEDLHASIEVCARAATRMQSVIERLLKLARGEASRLQLARVRLDLLVEQAIDQVRVLADAAGVRITHDLGPITIEADAEQLCEAVTNVVSNAIRYNVDGGRVEARVAAVDGQVEIQITDTGIGIPAADLPSIFEPFFRGDPARSRDTGGAGLGLAVARAVVTQHGGSMFAASEPGRGTSIRMVFPANGVELAQRSS